MIMNDLSAHACNPLLTCKPFALCRRLLTFENIMGPDQDQQNCLTLCLAVLLKYFLKKFIFERKSDDNKSMTIYPAYKELSWLNDTYKHSVFLM